MKDICPTHPWITFSVDTRKFSPKVWLLLGEARSKCNHLAGVPMSTQVAKNLHEVYLAKGIHATTSIEGNNLSEEQVLRIVRGVTTPITTQSYEEKEIVNIITATNSILDYVERHGIKNISVPDIKEYNKKILEGLPVDEHVVPGEFSRVQVGVPGYRGVPVDQAEPLMSKLCDWLNGQDFVSGDEEAIVYGLIKAIVAHLYLVWIHPFGDGNGRSARLLEARILLEAGVPSAACHLLSDHYNKTRPQYYAELAGASKSGGNITSFIEYAIAGFVQLLREQLLVVKNQQWSVSWINYVHDKFRGKDSKTEKRKRDLILALTDRGEGVTREDARHLSPIVAEEYAGLTDKTVLRDLHALVEMGLARRDDDRYFANREIILHFLPRAKKGDIAAQLEQANQALYGVSEDEPDFFTNG